MSKPVVVGRFGRAHGVRGDIFIISFTEPHTNILDYSPWLIEKNGEWQPLSITSTKLHDHQIVVHIKNCDDRDLAKLYTNSDIAVPIEALPKLEGEEYYWSQLIGLNVVNQQGETLGHVIEVLETGANDVLVVKGLTEHLVPYTKEAVLNIDLTTNQITVNWEPLD
jgi:16S rRNA processing protein RimM